MSTARSVTFRQSGKPVAPKRNRRIKWGGGLTNTLLLGPFLALFALFFVTPIGYALYLSLHSDRVSGLGITPNSVTSAFVGFQNYVAVLHDSAFLQSILRVLLYGVVQVPVTIALALALALLIDSGVVALARFFRLTFFVPYAIPGVIAVIIWSFVYTPDFSPILAVIHGIGFTNFSFVSSSNVLWSIANISTWQHAGYDMIVILAALQAIPRDLYEAARVDGASVFRIAIQIKLPLVIPAIVLASIFAIIGAIQLFSEPLVLKSIATTIPSTYTPNLVIYLNAFTNNNSDYAAALAVALAVVSFVLSFGFLRLMGRKSFETT